jgi:hypothetical protein
MVRKPTQLGECRLGLSREGECFGVQEAQRRTRRRVLDQLPSQLQQARSIAILARGYRFVVDRDRIGDCRGRAQYERLQDHCAHHWA